MGIRYGIEEEKKRQRKENGIKMGALSFTRNYFYLRHNEDNDKYFTFEMQLISE